MTNVSLAEHMFRTPHLGNDFDVTIQNWNLVNATSLTNAFYDSFGYNITYNSGTISLTGWNIGSSNQTTESTFRSMFYRCNKFNGDVSGWTITNPTSMSNMFKDCSQFRGIGLSSWTVSCPQSELTTFYQDNFNDRGDTNIDINTTYTYVLSNGYTCNLLGWDHTRTYANGFLRDSAGDATATIIGLIPNYLYSFRMSRFFTSDISNWHANHSLDINGVSYTVYQNNKDTPFEGIALSNSSGEIVFTFTQGNSGMVILSSLSIATKQGYSMEQMFRSCSYLGDNTTIDISDPRCGGIWDYTSVTNESRII